MHLLSNCICIQFIFRPHWFDTPAALTEKKHRKRETSTPSHLPGQNPLSVQTQAKYTYCEENVPAYRRDGFTDEDIKLVV